VREGERASERVRDRGREVGRLPSLSRECAVECLLFRAAGLSDVASSFDLNWNA
jgi:hypothetical protein